tara:strand:+ start:10366 stop:10806 length:441 start_codon:yes stop_codon:yes gene_type:complete
LEFFLLAYLYGKYSYKVFEYQVLYDIVSADLVPFRLTHILEGVVRERAIAMEWDDSRSATVIRCLECERKPIFVSAGNLRKKGHYRKDNKEDIPDNALICPECKWSIPAGSAIYERHRTIRINMTPGERVGPSGNGFTNNIHEVTP